MHAIRRTGESLPVARPHEPNAIVAAEPDAALPSSRPSTPAPGRSAADSAGAPAASEWWLPLDRPRAEPIDLCTMMYATTLP